MTPSWEEENEWERQWHGTCQNSLAEELKQLIYAEKMGFQLAPDLYTPYHFDMGGKSVVDVGGGAYSLLLKCINFKSATVIDPCAFPAWTMERYRMANITFIQEKAEDMDLSRRFDLAIMYNVLQHTENPQKVVMNLRRIAKEIRIFEYINTVICAGHPQSTTEHMLNAWLWGRGKTVTFHGEGGVWGDCYYGVFKGE